MNLSRVVKFKRGIRAAIAALALLAPLLLVPKLAAAAPQTAATCLAKFRACTSRCDARYSDHEKMMACIKRTCEKQHDNCLASIGLPPIGTAKPDAPKFDHFGTGILTTTGSYTQAPSATGSPIAPSAPKAPVIIY